MEKKGALVLEDGTVVEGKCFGAEGESRGEVVFNTSMVGYQEYLTDPSYRYQILMPTYPLIGNYGITPERFESDKIQVEGFVVKELCEKPSHGRITKTLDELLKEFDVPGLRDVDTRFLTRKIRVHGVMKGILKCPYEERELEDLKEAAEKMKSISEMDLVDLVTVKKPIFHGSEKAKKTVVLIDCGVKMSIVKSLMDHNIGVVRVPARTDYKKILNFEPDGIVVSNGPGDPERMDYVVDSLRKILDERIPTFGICLGNQLLGLAFGGKTYKLKFGHRGANQPVKDLETNKVYITSQNHGFAVDADSLDGSGTKVSHINLNDNSVEGIKHTELPAMSVQYHPEAHPGPWDNAYLFDEFMEMMR